MSCCLMAPSHYLCQCWLHHRWGPVTITWEEFHRRYISNQSLQLAWNYLSEISFKSPRGQWVKEPIFNSRYHAYWCTGDAKTSQIMSRHDTVECHHNAVQLIAILPLALWWQQQNKNQGAVSIRKTVLPGMAIPMLKIRRPNGRLIFNMEIAIRR